MNCLICGAHYQLDPYAACPELCPDCQSTTD